MSMVSSDCPRDVGASDPAETIKHANKPMFKFSDEIVQACIKNGIKTIERTPSLSVEEQFRLVREHFGF
jgi:hypothetical protein